MPLIRFALANSLLTNLLLALVLVAGVLAWYRMPQELFPNIETNDVVITVRYDGASPQTVEQEISIPIESEIAGMDGIDILRSRSAEGHASIRCKLYPGTDVDAFIRDVRSTLNHIRDFPENADPPEVSQLKARIPVIHLALYGEAGMDTLSRAGDALQHALTSLPGVASAELSGVRKRELHITLNPDRLRSEHISADRIRSLLQRNLRDIPGGSISATEGELLLRGPGNAALPETLAQLPVISRAGRVLLRLGQLADIRYDFAEPRTLARFNGHPSINITVSKTTASSSIRIAKAVRDLAADWPQQLPSGVKIGVYSDMSVYIKKRLHTVQSSALVGLVLVLLALYALLNMRVALVTALGIPVSFLIGIILMQLFGQTINMVSLFAFLLALGMVVDDAIIVTENIYRHLEEGMQASQAALIGVQEVFWPVLTATGTTVAAFLPMFVIGGTMGSFIIVIPIVVCACLFGSLLEAFLVLPGHAKSWLRIKDQGKQRTTTHPRLLQRYLALLRISLRHRGLTAACSFGLLIILLVFAVTRMRFMMFSQVDVASFFINGEAARTSSLEDTAALSQRVEQAIMATLHQDELDDLLSNVGISFVDFKNVRLDSNRFQFIVELSPRQPEGFIDTWITPWLSMNFEHGQRQRATASIIQDLRERLPGIPGLAQISIVRPQGGPSGSDLEIGLVGNDLDELRILSPQLAAKLRAMRGVFDVAEELQNGKPVLRYRLNPLGQLMGLSEQDLARAVRLGFQPDALLYLTNQGERIPVRLSFPHATRHDASALARTPVPLPDGNSVPLARIASIQRDRELDSISRRDRKRMAIVTAEVNADQITSGEASTLIQDWFDQQIKPAHPNISLLLLGEKRRANESVQDMRAAGIIALGLIFIMLAALFKSLLDPFVVMLAIPFGLIGVILGHLATGQMFQFLSMVGFLALSGIIVNDSLILVDYAKKLRADGMERTAAIIEAARVRSRPILLTSLTTFLGVSPLIFFATGQTAILSPMAVSLGFGLLAATAIILLILPSLYLLADDIKTFSHRLLQRLS